MNYGFRDMLMLLVVITASRYCAAGDVLLPALAVLEQRLDDALSQALATKPSFDALDSESLRRLEPARELARGGPQVWIDVLSQSEHHLCRLACLHHLKEERRDLQFLGLLLYLVSSDNALVTGERLEARQVLNEPPAGSDTSKAISLVLARCSGNAELRTRLMVVLEMCSAQSIIAWRSGADRETIPATQRALVLRQLLMRIESGELSRDDVGALGELESFAQIPGYPRLVNLLHASHSQDDTIALLWHLMSDSGISDLEFAIAIHRHREVIRRGGRSLLDVEGEIESRRAKLISRHCF